MSGTEEMGHQLFGGKVFKQKEHKESDLREEHAVLGSKRRAETRGQACRDL